MEKFDQRGLRFCYLTHYFMETSDYQDILVSEVLHIIKMQEC